ncbi:hypothetical protein PLESTM_000392500 [Pleodorina starrii]|nr:hypothetical protein PLESTM_000392500 [Pleodorina starrii]
MQALNILFITLEFRTGTFSGNGVYATAQVRALAAAGHRLFVISAAPAHAQPQKDDFGVANIFEVPVSSWHRLDAGAPWREFAAGVTDEAVVAAVASFAPDVVLAVDWSALPAVRNLAPHCGGAPYVYLNYRVFTRTAVGQDLDLVRGLEAAAMSEAVLTVALSRSDAEYLANHVAPAAAATARDPLGQVAAAAAAAAGRSQEPQGTPEEGQEGMRPPAGEQQQQEQQAEEERVQVLGVSEQLPGPASAAAHEFARTRVPGVLLPALREDVWQLEAPAELELNGSRGADADADAAAAAAAAWAASRPYFSCVVRLSPEKEPERFVALVEAMAARGLLERHRLTPLLLGVANDDFAQALKSRLRAAAPASVILESFMGPAELADLYRKTRLNFHPSTYDAYGMTIVEAASQGAPSVVHDGGGAVGATDLMRGPEGEVFLLDLAAPTDQLAESVSEVLANSAALAATSARAMKRARSWDEAANAAELVRLVREAITQCAAV